MDKLMVALSTEDSQADERLRAALLSRPKVGGLHRYTANLSTAREGKGAHVAAVLSLWVDDAAAVDLTALPSGEPRAYLVDERLQWDSTGDCAEGEPSPGIQQISFLRAAPGLGRQRFGAHWRDVHAPLARKHHPTLWRYVQNVVVDRLTPSAPEVDGIAELSFRSLDDLRDRMYDSDEGRAIIGADIRRFIDLRSAWRCLGVEHVVTA